MVAVISIIKSVFSIFEKPSYRSVYFNDVTQHV